MRGCLRLCELALGAGMVALAACAPPYFGLPSELGGLESESGAPARLAVSSTSPTTNAVNVGTTAFITIRFNRTIDFSSIVNEQVNASTHAILLKDAAGRDVDGTITYNAGARLVTFAPTAPLAPGERHTVTIKDVRDADGAALASTYRWSFTTKAARELLSATSTSPAHNATGVALNATISATFDQPVDYASFVNPQSNTPTGAFSVRGPDGDAVDGTVTQNNSTFAVTFVPAAALRPGTRYSVVVKDARGLQGEVQRTAKSWSFTTAATPAASAPAAVSTTPSDGATSVARNVTIAVRFNQALDPESVVNGTTNSSTGAILVKTAGGANVGGTVTYNPSTFTVMFAPTSWLTPNLTYIVTVKDVRNTSGRALANPFSWAFTTGISPGAAPQVSSTLPADNAVNVARDSTIRATFNEPVTGIAAATFFVRDTVTNATVTARSLTFDPGTRIATFRPTNNLSPNTTYTATVQDVTGLAGVLMPPHTWSFTTGATPNTAPAVVGLSPADGAVGVPRNMRLTATFDRAVTGVSTANFVLRNTLTNTLVTAETTAFSNVSYTATWQPSGFLAANTQYTATLRNLTGSDGIPVPETSWTFTTSATPDGVVPSITAGGLTVRANCANTVTLRWPPATDDATPQANITYAVFRADLTGGYDYSAPLATTAAGAESHVVTGLTPGTTHFFTVRALDAAGNSSASFTERSVILPAYFDCPASIAVAGGPRAVAAADLNEDSLPDLAIACIGANSVVILLGNGDGTFTAATPLGLAAGAHPVDIKAGDFNGDAHLDLATANRDNNTVVVFLGAGDGSFGAGIVTAVTRPQGLAPGEFNNPANASLDLAVATGNDVLVLPGAGDGTFGAAVSLIVAGTADTGAVVTGDFDGDGLTDVGVSWTATDNAGVFVNATPGGGGLAFTAPSTATNRLFSVQNAPGALLAADLNLDAIPDLVVANAGQPSITVRHSSALVSNLFPSGENTALPAAANPAALAVGDVDGDFLPDVISANRGTDTVSVFVSLIGSGTFVVETQDAGGTPTGATLADFDQDGDNDIVLTCFNDDVVTILLNNR